MGLMRAWWSLSECLVMAERTEVRVSGWSLGGITVVVLSGLGEVCRIGMKRVCVDENVVGEKVGSLMVSDTYSKGRYAHM